MLLFKEKNSGDYSHEYIGNIEIPEVVTYEGKTYNVTTLGRYAFSLNSDIKNIHIPNSITKIEESAFQNYTGPSAFHRCYELATIYMNGTTPPVAVEKSFTFSNDTYTKATLYVPKGSICAYRTASVWREFTNIQEYDSKVIDNIDVSNVAYIKKVRNRYERRPVSIMG